MIIHQSAKPCTSGGFYTYVGGCPLALKMTAGRPKDLDDCAILLPKTSIQTVEQAQELLNRYILPEAQEEYAEQIEKSLSTLFRGKSS
jgi:hypothetical protein